MALIAGVALLAIGVSVGVLLVPAATPEGIASTAPIGSAPATPMSSVDPQPATLAIVSSDAQKLVSPVAGTVTSTNCTVGGAFASGTSGISIDDAPLVAFASARPLWRDLQVGDSGDDVRSLQQELARLGHDVGTDGHFGRRTLSAVIAAAQGAGMIRAKSWTFLPVSSFLWLPAPTVGIATCDALLGTRVEEGSPLASLPQGISAARVSPLPRDVFPGDRVVKAGDLTIPVDGWGAVTSGEALESLARSDAYAAFRAQGLGSAGGADAPAPAGMSVQFELAAPVSVVSVPAAALYGTKDTTACVLGDGRPVRVTVVGSQLGQAFVIPADGADFSAVSLTTSEARSCG